MMLTVNIHSHVYDGIGHGYTHDLTSGIMMRDPELNGEFTGPEHPTMNELMTYPIV
jgi:hypothetical protein